MKKALPPHYASRTKDGIVITPLIEKAISQFVVNLKPTND
jgi:hypothetical protein